MTIKRKNEICQVCGKPSPKLICSLCARRLTEQARHEHNRHDQNKLRIT